MLLYLPYSDNIKCINIADDWRDTTLMLLALEYTIRYVSATEFMKSNHQ